MYLSLGPWLKWASEDSRVERYEIVAQFPVTFTYYWLTIILHLTSTSDDAICSEVAKPDYFIGMYEYLDGCSPLLSPSAWRTPHCSHIQDLWRWRASGFGYWTPLAGTWVKMTGRRGHSALSWGSGDWEGKNRWEEAMSQEGIGVKQAELHKQMSIIGLKLLTLKEARSSSWGPLPAESCPAS